MAPGYDLAESLYLDRPAQYRALFEPTRQQIVSLLLDRAATTSELADLIGRPKGTIGHHLKALEAAGLVRVVRTQRVRALEAKYYGRTARVFLVESVGGAIGMVPRQIQQAADEASAVHEPTELAMNGGVRYARISADRAEEWSGRVVRLLDEFDRQPRGGDQTFGLVVAVYPTDRLRLAAAGVPGTVPDEQRADPEAEA